MDGVRVYRYVDHEPGSLEVLGDYPVFFGILFFIFAIIAYFVGGIVLARVTLLGCCIFLLWTVFGRIEET